MRPTLAAVRPGCGIVAVHGTTAVTVLLQGPEAHPQRAGGHGGLQATELAEAAAPSAGIQRRWHGQMRPLLIRPHWTAPDPLCLQTPWPHLEPHFAAEAIRIGLISIAALRSRGSHRKQSQHIGLLLFLEQKAGTDQECLCNFPAARK